MKRPTGSAKFATRLTIAYVGIASLGMAFHEMWRDELEIFAKIRDNSLIEVATALFDTNVYFYLLFGFVKLFASTTFAFQLFHLAAAAAAIYVFGRFSPFRTGQKILFAVGYFPLFEYGIISRGYGFGCLLTWVAVALITRTPRNLVAVTVALVLLANHGLFAAFLSIGLTVYVALDLVGRTRVSGLARGVKRQLTIALPMFTVGWALQAWKYYILAATRSGQFEWIESAPASWIARAIWNAYVPLPDLSSPQFWNTNILAFQPVQAGGLTASDGVALVLSVGLVLVAGLIFSRRPAVLAAYLVATALHLVFLGFISVLFVRYTGFLFVGFVACCWLLVATDRAGPARPPGIRSRLADPLLIGLLLVQCSAGAYAYVQDLVLPFSGSAAAARYIRENDLTDRPMIGMVDYVAAPVAIRLDRKIFYPQSRSYGSYIDWRGSWNRHEPSFRAAVNDASKLLRRDGQPVLLILSFEVQSRAGGPLEAMNVSPGIGLRRLTAIEHSIVGDERYYLYEIHRQ